VVLGRLGIQGTSQYGLMGEGGRGVTGQAHVHSSVDHGFHEEKDVGRSRAGKGGGHVNEGFVVDMDLENKHQKKHISNQH